MIRVESRAVDAVGDDPVLAFEVPCDEVTRRHAHRHVNVKPVEIAFEERPAVVVAEVAPSHRVEGADIRAAVKPQHRDRQRGHERLVIVHNVEVVLVEQRAHPANEVERQRDARHGAVGPDRHATADAHVPGDAVVVADAAGRREHGHVVAASPELCGKVADMLGDPPGVHEVVGGDEADLHCGAVAGQMGSRTCHCSGCKRMASSKMQSRIGTIAAPARMAISTDPIGIGAGWPKNSSGSPFPMRSRSSAMATTPPDRRTLKTSRIDAAPRRRAAWGSPSRIAWVSIGMMWTPWARRAPITRSKSSFGRRTSASSAILPPILFHPARPTSQDPKCIDATTTPFPRAMAS